MTRGTLDRCVYCRKRPIDPAWRPFCSSRCRTLDLARWIDGDYRVPGEPVESEPADPEDTRRRTE